MRSNVKLAKGFMRIIPSKPKYNAEYFKQEYFRHPDYIGLTEKEKQEIQLKWVDQAVRRAEKKPFEQYYKEIDFGACLKGKTVLDLGCGIGGKPYYLAEKYGVEKIYGIDVDNGSIGAANTYLEHSNSLTSSYDFRCAYAEDLPFSDNKFDTIISHDTLEHVRDLKKTLGECKRTVKKGGMIFLVFPSIFLPFGGAHIGSATKTPFLEWLFTVETLNRAYCEIVSGWDKSLDWYGHISDEKYGKWEKIEGGIGVNGTTHKEFCQTAEQVGFTNIQFFKTPLLSVSFLGNKYPAIRMLSGMLNPLMRTNPLIDYLSHRLVYCLTA